MSENCDGKCVFCTILKERRDEIVVENEHCFAIFDKYPASAGHMLVVPKRHVSSFFELDEREVVDAYNLTKRVKALLDEKYRPDGYNVGVNVGGAAGQTIWHVHIHVIPRYLEDVNNPTGGVRNVIPGKGDYTRLRD